jgi:preprotein translocase subunit SecG
MLKLILILAILVSVVLMLVVLIQNPKGSGLASNFSAGNQFFGVKKTTDLVEKITWACAGLIMVISLIAASYNPDYTTIQQGDSKSNTPGKIDKQLEEIINNNLPATTPKMPDFDDFESQDGGQEQGPQLPGN